MQSASKSPAEPFDAYQKFVIAALAFLQFTVILDFMIMSPLGAVLMPAMSISTAQFGLVVSIYAFSAGAAGFLSAGFADKYDRKKILIFFYTGFIVGTFLCAIATSYYFLLAARMVTGIFGGVIGSVVMAITTDLFPLNMRGRVMGFLQSAFAASQILGLPAGLYLSNHWGWRAPFLMIVIGGILAGIVILARLKPVNAHLKLHPDRKALHHLITTVSTPRYLFAFSATALLSLGGFMLMPFGSAYTVNNLGIHVEDLPLIYLISGITSMFIGPLVGRATDRFGKLPTFVFGTFFSIVMVLVYTNLGKSTLPIVILVNSLLFIGIFSRMIPSQTLMSAIPEPANRGAFMSVGSSVQQVAGGFASMIAGLIVIQNDDGILQHFEVLGYILVGTSLITLVMMYLINRMVISVPRS